MGQIIPLSPSPQDRLRLALRRLDSALEDQHAAIVAFQENLAGLRDSVTGLRGSYAGFGASLAALRDDLATAHDTARAIEGAAPLKA